MASNLFDMFSHLASDSSKLERFKSDPDSVMDDYNLSHDQKTLIKNGLANKQHDFHQVVAEEAHKHFGSGGEFDPGVC